MRKCWFPAFSHFPKMFSKAFLRSLQGCLNTLWLGKGINNRPNEIYKKSFKWTTPILESVQMTSNCYSFYKFSCFLCVFKKLSEKHIHVLCIREKKRGVLKFYADFVNYTQCLSFQNRKT